MTRITFTTLRQFDLWTGIIEEARKPNAYLLPIRIFLAVGWLRAFAEKLMDPAWLTGQTLTKFLLNHMYAGMPYAAYQQLVQNIFMPNAAFLAALVLVGQLLVGLGLLVGLFTPLALFGAFFMNLNFLLTGSPDPSAFYIVLQFVLLMGRAGEVFGLDGIRKRAQEWQPPLYRQANISKKIRLISLICAACSVGVAAIAFGGIMHFDPAASVKDAAAVLCVLACVGLGLSMIAYLRHADWG